LAAEYSVQGLSARMHPMQIIRDTLSVDNIIRSSEVSALPSGARVRIAGYVVCRQAPRTAKGHVFLTVEDETGLVNVILKPDTYRKYRYTVRTEPLVLIEGVFQKRDGISNIIAETVSALKRDVGSDDAAPAARNFR
jgi:error-prone DNA polymerase